MPDGVLLFLGYTVGLTSPDPYLFYPPVVCGEVKSQFSPVCMIQEPNMLLDGDVLHGHPACGNHQLAIQNAHAVVGRIVGVVATHDKHGFR